MACKVQNLVELKKLLITTEPAVDELSEDVYLLNRYYVENRYPGDYPEITWPEAEQALAAAMRIKEFVLEKIQKTP